MEHNPPLGLSLCKEGEGVNPLNLAIKQTLNSLAGVYLCINLIDGKIYVGAEQCFY